jgi:argininosuccinate lyase
MSTMTTLWGGRFSGRPDDLMRRFGDSIQFDIRLWECDVAASVAYAKALAGAGVISQAQRDDLLAGLEQVRCEFADDRFVVQPDDEDIHTAVERRLADVVGEVAGTLHTGRSRNDQVATDTRLYLRGQIGQLEGHLVRLQRALVDRAKSHARLVMPGYTHLQPAQPVRFSHWLLSFFWMFQRDRDRLADLTRRVNVLPLGSGALSGNPMGIDQAYLARELGFDGIAPNSMDAVSDRDYLVEFLSWASLTQIHLSRLAEDLILYSSREFGFVEISDAYDKECMFDAIDTMAMTLPIAAGVIETLTVHGDRMQAALADEMLATELADYLVIKGVPFRQAHHLVGRVVLKALEQGESLRALPLSHYRAISELFASDLTEWLDFERAVERRNSVGGTALESVTAQLVEAERLLKQSPPA